MSVTPGRYHHERERSPPANLGFVGYWQARRTRRNLEVAQRMELLAQSFREEHGLTCVNVPNGFDDVLDSLRSRRRRDWIVPFTAVIGEHFRAIDPTIQWTRSESHNVLDWRGLRPPRGYNRWIIDPTEYLEFVLSTDNPATIEEVRREHVVLPA